MKKQFKALALVFMLLFSMPAACWSLDTITVHDNGQKYAIIAAFAGIFGVLYYLFYKKTETTDLTEVPHSYYFNKETADNTYSIKRNGENIPLITIKLSDQSIIKQPVDYIVNPSNEALCLMGGVSETINKASVPLGHIPQINKDPNFQTPLQQELYKFPVLNADTEKEGEIRCRTGDAVMTPSFKLREGSYLENGRSPDTKKPHSIIHAVGPIVEGDPTEKDLILLKSAYIKSLILANNNESFEKIISSTKKPVSIAFPAISGGIFAPKNNTQTNKSAMAQAALDAVYKFATTTESLRINEVIFALPPQKDERYFNVFDKALQDQCFVPIEL